MTPICHDMGFHDVLTSEFLKWLAQAERRPGKRGR